MASSYSPLNMTCAHCKDCLPPFRHSWELSPGKYAQLCQRCYSVYKAGRFCETFHSNKDGWMNCAVCDKPIHLFCASFLHQYLLLDNYRVRCIECPNDNFPKSESRQACVHCKDCSSPLRDGWEFRGRYDPLYGWEFHDRYCQLCRHCYSVFKTGRFCGRFHYYDDGWRNCAFCDKRIHCGCISSMHQYVLLDDDGVRCIDCPKDKSPRNESSQIRNHAQGARMEPNSGPKSDIIPWFEKILTASDANPDLGRIVIPKKHALTYFPEVSDHPNGILLDIVDDKGKEWEVCFRYWNINGARKMYVLQGLQAFKLLRKVEAGDTVSFSGREIDRKILIGLRKTSTHEGQYLPTMAPNDWPHNANLETRGISIDPRYAVTPLFDKILTTTDAGAKFGRRIVIPKKLAEDYFPKISDPQGGAVTFSILDYKGKERRVRLRYWASSSKYVLTGLKDLMIKNNLQPSDLATFSWVEPIGKIIIGFIKSPTEKAGSN